MHVRPSDQGMPSIVTGSNSTVSGVIAALWLSHRSTAGPSSISEGILRDPTCWSLSLPVSLVYHPNLRLAFSFADSQRERSSRPSILGQAAPPKHINGLLCKRRIAPEFHLAFPRLQRGKCLIGAQNLLHQGTQRDSCRRTD